MRIDLHTHSTCSDGTTTPREVIAEASAAGLDVVALTDHDTVAGWDEAEAAALEHGVDLVRGIEISCKHDGISLHLLAYLPAREGALYDELEQARVSRVTRAERMVERLAEEIPLTIDDVLAHTSEGATIGRPHIADAMVAKGVVGNRGEAFERYLYSGSPYHVGHYALDPIQAVELVRAAGGVPVFAHPLASNRGRIVDDAVIYSMIDAGLGGLEADHRDHSPEQVAKVKSIAAERGVFVTGSSDFHGAGKPNRLGEHVTSPQVLEQILEQAHGVPLVRARQ